MNDTAAMSGAALALRWITELLTSHAVPFQVAGGLAARAYGASRPLVDIDLFVPGDRLPDVAQAAAPYLVRPPELHEDECWQITFMAAVYEGQRVEVGSAEARYFDRAAGEWRSTEVDFALAPRRVVLGVIVPVMPLPQLVEYKRRLGRPVDLVDLEELARCGAV